jgi:integral membrane sensor domain MASE1
VPTFIAIVAIAAAYNALGALSAQFAYAETDAWAVWLAVGIAPGLLLSRPRSNWPAIIAGVALGAFVFGLITASGVLHSALYACVEVVTALAGAWTAARIAPLPLKLDSPRELAALTFGGALATAATGGLIIAVWNVLSGDAPGDFTFRVWTASGTAGALLVAPVIVSWQQFRVKRSGGLPMRGFIAGAVAAVCVLGGIVVVFATSGPGGYADTLAYLPLLFLTLVALLWGVRGASLVTFIGAIIALAYTTSGRGPFVGSEGLLGGDALEVQGYSVTMALTGLLIAVLAAAQHNALRAAREWQTRFEAAIGAHRLLAYEWDPASGRLAVTGDAQGLLGVAPAKLATLADWLALVAPDARERVGSRFDERIQSEGGNDVFAYPVLSPGGERLDATDEARAIRDHDGALHRVVGIVRFAAAA